MFKHFTTILLSLFSIGLTYAQSSIDSTKVDTTYKRLGKFPILTTNYSNYGNSAFETNGQRGRISMHEWSMVLQIAIPLKEKKLYLYNKTHYTNFTFSSTLNQGDSNFLENFHSIAFTIGLIKILPKRWRLITNLTPTLASDFEQTLKSDDFIFQASTLAIKRASPHFEYGFGLSFTTKFGNALIIPLIKLTYVKNNWETLAVLPAYVSQNYKFSENTKLGLKLSVYGNLYNVKFDNISSNHDLNRVSYSRINIGPDFQTKLFGDIYLNAGTGLTVRNILEFQDNDLNTELDLNTGNKFFFNIGVKLLK